MIGSSSKASCDSGPSTILGPTLASPTICLHPFRRKVRFISLGDLEASISSWMPKQSPQALLWLWEKSSIDLLPLGTREQVFLNARSTSDSLRQWWRFQVR